MSRSSLVTTWRNASIVRNDLSNSLWPLFCDPQRRNRTKSAAMILFPSRSGFVCALRASDIGRQRLVAGVVSTRKKFHAPPIRTVLRRRYPTATEGANIHCEADSFQLVRVTHGSRSRSVRGTRPEPVGGMVAHRNSTFHITLLRYRWTNVHYLCDSHWN
jgi:hypothetical protein